MNPRDELLSRLIRENKSDAEITAALAEFDTSQAPAPPASGGESLLSRAGDAVMSGINTVNKRVADGLGRKPEDAGGIPRRFGEAAMSAVGAIPGSDEALGALAGWQSLQRGQNPIEGYKTARKALNDRFKQADSASGSLGTAARVGTMFLPIGPAARGVKAAVNVGTRTGRVARAAQELGIAAGTGAAYGGAAGALNAEGTDRIKEGLKGGAFGGLFGTFLAGLPMVGRGLRDYVGGDIKGTKTRRVSEALNEVLERQGVPADKMRGDLTDIATAPAKAPNAWKAATGLVEAPGSYASGKRVMDASPEMRELAKDAANASPQAERALGLLAQKRVRQQNPALAQDFAEGIGARPGVNAERARDAITEQTSQLENQLYPKLFQAHPDPVETEQAISTWKMADELLPKYANAVQRNQQLASQPMNEVVRVIEDQPVPTMEGLHRLKVLTGSALRALGKQESAGSLSDEGVALQRSLSLFQSRVRDALETAPGGDIYAGIQAMGASRRAATDALDAGLEVAGPKMRGYTAKQALDQAQAALPQGGGAALRQGAATRVANDASAAKFDSNEILGQLAKEPATQEAVDALAADPKNAALFAKKMRDRIAMQETNAMQLGGATKQKEILRGARSRGTAAVLGEAGAVAGAVTGNPARVGQGAALAGGAMLSKLLDTFRGKALEGAGDELAYFLSRGSGNRQQIPLLYFDNLMANARLQQQRLQNAARRGVVAGGAAAAATRDR